MAVAQDDPLEGFKFNEHVLSDGSNAQAWVTAECTVQSALAYARDGAALQMHIPVDYSTGEPQYPIGWPRMYLAIPEGERNWTGYDFLSLWIYPTSSRETLPRDPLGLIVRCPDKAHSYHRALTELVKGQWTHIVVPISELPNSSNCAAIQFFISESHYADGDIVDFYIDDLCLLTYAEPTILQLQPMTALMYSDASCLRVSATVAGLEEGATTGLTCQLKSGDEVLAEDNLTVRRGEQSFLLNFGGGLHVSECTLQASLEGSDRVVTVPIRVVTSPWEGSH
ncbi:MAG: hypothetical protein J7M38_04705 [Armatimonadetes bacterium]|nr:hypothetical protein [Armatimonadota bacterium]